MLVRTILVFLLQARLRQLPFFRKYLAKRKHLGNIVQREAIAKPWTRALKKRKRRALWVLPLQCALSRAQEILNSDKRGLFRILLPESCPANMFQTVEKGGIHIFWPCQGQTCATWAQREQPLKVRKLNLSLLQNSVRIWYGTSKTRLVPEKCRRELLFTTSRAHSLQVLRGALECCCPVWWSL